MRKSKWASEGPLWLRAVRTKIGKRAMVPIKAPSRITLQGSFAHPDTGLRATARWGALRMTNEMSAHMRDDAGCRVFARPRYGSRAFARDDGRCVEARDDAAFARDDSR